MGYITAFLPGHADANLPGHSLAFPGWERHAGLLFLESTILLGQVGAFLLLDAGLPGHPLASLFGLNMACLPGDVDALFLGLVVAFLSVLNMDGGGGVNNWGGVDNGLSLAFTFAGVVSNDLLALLVDVGSLLFQLAQDLFQGTLVLTTFAALALITLGLGLGLHNDRVRLGDGWNGDGDLDANLLVDVGALLVQVGNADLLVDSLADLVVESGADGLLDALLLPDHVAVGDGMPRALLLHHERALLLVLGRTFTSMHGATAGSGLDIAGILVDGATLLHPDVVVDSLAASFGYNVGSHGYWSLEALGTLVLLAFATF